MKLLKSNDNRGLISGPERQGVVEMLSIELENVYRVVPETAADIYWLASLAHQSEKHAPLHGNGILVKQKLVRKYLNG